MPRTQPPDPTTPTTAATPETPAAPSTTIDRRDLIKASGLGAAAAVVGGAIATTGPASQAAATPSRLRFPRNRPLRIVQLNDTQDDERIDRRTVQLVEAVLDDTRPDLVILNGDNITGGCDTAEQVRQAINNVVKPIEDRGIFWAGNFGNHDEDSTAATGVDATDQLGIYRNYDHNLNGPVVKGVRGNSNTVITVAGSRRRAPAFSVFLLDGGRYAPEDIDGQDFAGYPTWDWVRTNQIGWYTERSRELERQAGAPVPGLMFVHIPLWEFRFMWWGSVDERTEASAARGAQRHGIEGERNEDECPGPFNSGLFSAVLERGDVTGIFSGHDHVNTYVGNYYGVRLGYAGSAGFGTYGLPGADRNRLRGARVFDVPEDDPAAFTTRMVFAADYGIDLTPDDQGMDALPF